MSTPSKIPSLKQWEITGTRELRQNKWIACVLLTAYWNLRTPLRVTAVPLSWNNVLLWHQSLSGTCNAPGPYTSSPPWNKQIHALDLPICLSSQTKISLAWWISRFNNLVSLPSTSMSCSKQPWLLFTKRSPFLCYLQAILEDILVPTPQLPCGSSNLFAGPAPWKKRVPPFLY